MRQDNLTRMDILEMVKNRQISSKEGLKLIKSLTRTEIVQPPPPDKTPDSVGIQDHRIAIIGISGRFPDAENINEFWDNLTAGRDSVREIPVERWGMDEIVDKKPDSPGGGSRQRGGFISAIDHFDPLFFNISPREAELMDPQQRIFLEEAWRALEDAGYSSPDISNKRCGVFVGFNSSDYQVRLQRGGVEVDAYYFTGNTTSVLSARISYFLNMKGPSMVIDTACSSSLVSIHLASESIRCGTSELALAGGVMLMATGTFYKMLGSTEMLSPGGRCRTFDNGADGFIPGEGVGVVVLKPLDMAVVDRDHIYGVIIGSGINQDGKSNGITAPSATSQAALECEVYSKYNINPETIGYVEAHGTGTKLGDPIEVHALTDAFRKYTGKRQFCAIGSVKTNIGHTMAAAGIAGLIKVLLSLKHKKLVPSLHLERENEHINFKESPFYVNTGTKEWQPVPGMPRRAAISAFGMSGTNAHMVLEEYLEPAMKPDVGSQSRQLIVLSARSSDRLNAYVGEMIEFLECRKSASGTGKYDISLVDLAYTLQMGREGMEERLALVVSNPEELSEKLGHFQRGVGGIKDLYHGNLKSEKKTSELLIEGESGEAFLRTIIENRELGKLGQLWVSGVEIDWNIFYAGSKPRRISLPTYPFARERYWVPETPRGVQGRKYGEYHPLLGRIEPRLSMSPGIVFRQILKPTDPIVRDHQVHHTPILPGVGYLEMAYAAGSFIAEGKPYRLSHAVWLQPLAISNGRREVRVVLEEQDEHFYYRIQSLQEDHLLTHAEGELYITEGCPDQFITLDEIKARCERHMDSETLYGWFEEIGITYGEYFRGIKELWGSEREVLSRIILPSVCENEFSNYTLHPGLMDSALQSIAGILTNTGNKNPVPMVPYSVEEVELRHPLQPSGYAYIKSVGDFRFNVAIVDDNGRVCLKFHDFSIRPLLDPLDRMFYLPRWLSCGAVAGQEPEKSTGERGVLIIYSSGGEKFEDVLTALYSGDNIVKVCLGRKNRRLDEGHREVDCTDPEGMTGCLDRTDRPDVVYFLGGIQLKSADPADLEGFSQCQEQGVLSLFRLIKFMIGRGWTDESLDLRVVTNDIYPVHPGASRYPQSAAIPGLIKSFSKEYPHWTVRYVDLSITDLGEAPEAADIRSWLRPLILTAEEDGFEELVVRRGRNFRKNLEPVRLRGVGTGLFREKGVYMIVGGGGGIGLELGRYLARRYSARLVLVGRSQLKGSQREKIGEIESSGGEVLYVRGDVGDVDSINNVVAEAKTKFGCINGVVHSAIVLQDKTLANMDEETFRAALIPKVWGSKVLHRAFAGEDLDFMIFFSAGQSFICNAGQSNYAAGCTFKDAYASYIGSVESYPVKIINWGYWGSVGVVSGENYNRRLAQQGVGSIEPAEGMEALERILFHPVEQVLVIKGEDRFLESLGIERSRIRELYGVGPLPQLPDLAGRVKPPSIDRDMSRDFEAGLEALNGLGARWLLNAFRRMGAFLKEGEGYNVEALCRRLGIVPDYQRLYREMLCILSRHGFVKLQGDEVESLAVLSEIEFQVDVKHLEAERTGLVSGYPDLSNYVDLLWACVSSYPEVLTGKKSHMEVMFPGGSLELVEGVYRGTAVTDYCNRLVSGLLKSYIDIRLEMSPAERIEILEVGAGTGGTSGIVLEMLKERGDQVRYWYTDISRGFTEHGHGRFGTDYPFVEYKVLDIEKPVESQGFELGSIDFLFGSNVFHATQRISETLNQAKRLLKPGGFLLLSEATAREDFATLTFGLTEGWWRFEDEEIRLAGSPLLSVPLWREALNLAGFRGIEVLIPSGDSDETYGHSVIFGVSDGEVVEEAGTVSVVSDDILEPAAAVPENLCPKEDEPVESFGEEPDRVVASGSVCSEESLRSSGIEYVKDIFSEVLKIGRERIDAGSTFERYGVDSLVGMEIIRRFERDFGKLPATLLFEYLSVEKLADYFLTNHRQRLTELCGDKADGNESKKTGELFQRSRSPRNAGAVPLGSLKKVDRPAQSVEKEDTVRRGVERDEPSSPVFREIAVIGLSGRYPLSETVDKFWENLALGRSCIREIPKGRWDWRSYQEKCYTHWGGFIEDVDKFDPLFFNITPLEAEGMDPQERLFLETSWSTIEDAGYTRRDFERLNFQVGVFVGVMNCDYEWLSGAAFALGHESAAHTSYWSIANRVSYCFNFQGPSLAVDTACSSSLTAIHLACESLRHGECRLAVAGGVNVIIHPVHFQRLCAVNMLSRDRRCKTFGEGADGFVDGEGVGAVLLKPLDQAVDDSDHIYGVIKGSSVNAGGKTSGYTVPNPNAQGDLISRSFQNSGIDSRTISYVEAHGTGTALGDPIEIAGLVRAFRNYTKDIGFCSVGSVKSNIGHLESAAGIAALTKVLLQMKHKKLVPSLHSRVLNPEIEFENSPFYVQRELTEWQRPEFEKEGKRLYPPRRAGISSFGAGGANVHLIVEEFVDSSASHEESEPIPQVFVLSAKNEERLKAYAEKIVGFLDRETGIETVPSFDREWEFSVDEIEKELTGIVSSILQVGQEDIKTNEALGDYGFDAVNWTDLEQQIDRRYDLHAEDPLLLPEITIELLADQVAGLRSANESSTPPEQTISSARPQRSPGFSCADLAYTLQIGREAMPERLAVVALTLAELKEKLVGYGRGETEMEGFYHGNSKTDRAPSILSANGRAVKKLVGLLMNDRDLAGLAQLWIAGVNVDWSQLHRNTPPKRIPLPTYPFAGDRYWIPGFSLTGRVADPQALDLEDKLETPPVVDWPEENKFTGDPEDDGMLTAATENYLKEVIAGQIKLKPEQIDPRAGFEDYGLDSILINQFNERLSKSFGKLPATLFFKYKNLRSLAGYFVENHRQEAQALVTSLPGRKRIEPPMSSLKRSRVPSSLSIGDRNITPAGSAGNERIAVIGLSGQYPMAADVETFWENLKAEKDCIEEIPSDRWDFRPYFDPEKGNPGKIYCKWGGFLDDVDKFDAQFFNISPGEAKYMNPQERLFLQVAWLCLEDAGYTRDAMADPNAGDRRGDVGVFVGMTFNDYPLFGAGEWEKGRAVPVHSHTFAVANRVSYFLNLKGPSFTVDTACSSSLFALHLACESIIRRENRMAIAGGVNLTLHPSKYISLCAIQMLSGDGRCRAFAEGGDGMVSSEGVGAVLLKPLPEAIKDRDHIYTVILGSAVNHDGKTHGFTVPNPVAQSEVIQTALDKAGIDPRSISYVEAHGTGTSLGDPIEITGLSDVYRKYTPDKQYCSIGSVKSNIGHAEAAAGISQLTKVILQMKYKTLVPSLLHTGGLNRKIDFDNSPFFVQQTQADWVRPKIGEGDKVKTVPLRAGISSFGAGGVNVHVIIEEYPGEGASAHAVAPDVEAPALMERVFPAALENIKHVTADDDDNRFKNVYIDFQEWCRVLLLATFQKMGLFRLGDESYEEKFLEEKVQLIPSQKLTFAVCLEILSEAGFITVSDLRIQSTTEVEAPDIREKIRNLEHRKNEFIEESPKIEPFVNLVWRCMKSYPEIFRGDISPTAVLFPHSSLELVEGIYRRSDSLNLLAAEFLKLYIENRRRNLKGGEKIKIAEIGAGTGGTTAVVLKAIGEYSEDIDYSYTDISRRFLMHAEDKFSEHYSFVEYRILDIEKGLPEQGFGLKEFDIVIAANVLHATRNMRHTLSNLKSMLKTNGVLIARETTVFLEFTSLTFGLLDGWRIVDDRQDRIPGSPLLSCDIWQRVLERCGYRKVSFYSPDNNFESLILAESDGAILPPLRGREVAKAGQTGQPLIFFLSTRTDDNLKEYAVRLKTFLERREGRTDLPSIVDTAYTLQVGREPMARRLAVLAASHDELLEKLERFIDSDSGAPGLDGGGIFIGDTGKESPDPPMREADMVELVRQRLWSDVARRWVQGENIDWRICYPGSEPSRVSLPAYPFLKQRYWFAEANGLPDLKGGQSRSETFNEEESVGGAKRSGESDPSSAFLEELADAFSGERLELLKRYLQGVTGKILGFVPPDLPGQTLGFFDMGMESIQAMKLVMHVGELFHLQVEPTILFDHPNIAAFSRYLEGQIDFTRLGKNREGTDSGPAELVGFHAVWEKTAGVDDSENQAAGDSEPAGDLAGPILVFDDETGLRDTLAAQLSDRQSGTTQLILVKTGTRFRKRKGDVFELNPEEPEGYRQLFQQLADRHMLPGCIVHRWSTEVNTLDDRGIKAQLDQGLYSIFHISRELMNRRPGEKVHFLYLYRTDKRPSGENLPLRSAVQAAARTVHLENRRFIYKTVELDSKSMDLRRLSMLILEECSRDAEDEVDIRYDDGSRYVRYLKAYDLEGETDRFESDRIVRLRENGVYLITGGLGGVGSLFAGYLSQKVKARLVLTGRSPLTGEKRIQLQKLEDSGSQALYFQADISREDEVKKLVSEIRRRFKRIDGILHCAGVIRDAFITKKRAEDIEAVLAPKVNGTIFLDRATETEDLDFFVLFSSNTAWLGNIGQIDYSYANRFMDHFAVRREELRREKRRAGRTVSIGWPHWQSGGMTIDDQTEAFLKKTFGMAMLSDEEGLAVFEKVLLLDIPQLGLFKGVKSRVTEVLGIKPLPQEEAGEPVDADGIPKEMKDMSDEEVERLLETELVQIEGLEIEM